MASGVFSTTTARPSASGATLRILHREFVEDLAGRRQKPLRHARASAPSMSSRRATERRTLRALARKPAEGSLPSAASRPPCSAIACAAYSIGVRRRANRWRCAMDCPDRGACRAAVDRAAHPTIQAVEQAHAAAVRNALARCRRGRVFAVRSCRCLARSATSSTLANGVPSLIGMLCTREAQALQQRHPVGQRPAPGRRHAVAADARDGAVDPLADREAAAAGRVADAQQQPARPAAARRARGAARLPARRGRRSAARRG